MDKIIENKIAQLESVIKLKSEFTSNISHELKTPLNSIIGFSSILCKNKKNNLDEKQLKYLHTINKNGEKLLKIIEQVIELNRIDLGIIEQKTYLIDIDDTIKYIVDLLQTQADEKALSLEYKNLTTETKCLSNGVKLEQILLHLITNAIKYTDMSIGKIEIELNQDQYNWIILIKDNGIGFENIDVINNFNSYNQYDKLSASLSVIKYTASLLNANIKLESTYKEGSTFILTISKKVGTNE